MNSFSEAVTLSNEFVRLEQLSVEHAADLSEAAGEGELWRKAWYTTIPAPDRVEAEIERRLELQRQGRMAPWAVVDPEAGKAVGMTTYFEIDEANRRLEMGYTWLGVKAQGRAINPAMKLLLLGRAFEELDAIAVALTTNFHNHQSRAAIAKLGAKQDGILRSHKIGSEGVVRDTVVFSIIASEWPGVRFGLRRRLGLA